jgi:nitroimidazol reductase NimA-like FMN-containing flavoprotein (pyridoxamine 5'-phosphate oxidase superfamily)
MKWMPEAGDVNRDLEFMERLLAEEEVGRLALCCDDEPYVIAINYTYADGRVLIHCALEGKKLDMIRHNPDACFEVSRQDGPPVPHAGNKCDMPFESVLCFGRARVVDNVDERVDILNRFQARYDTPEKTRDPLTPEDAEKCGAIVIEVERMTGRNHPDDHAYEWERSGDA